MNFTINIKVLTGFFTLNSQNLTLMANVKIVNYILSLLYLIIYESVDAYFLLFFLNKKFSGLFRSLFFNLKFSTFKSYATIEVYTS